MADNGLKQTPFSDAWPTPDVGGTGINGIGGGLDEPGGAQGIISSPFSQACVPTPSGAAASGGDLPTPPAFSSFTDSQPPNTAVNPQEITSSRNTVDRR